MATKERTLKAMVVRAQVGDFIAGLIDGVLADEGSR